MTDSRTPGELASELLAEMYALILDGKVKFVEPLGGGIWTWPDRCLAALKDEKQ